jgi:hypothetical protein
MGSLPLLNRKRAGPSKFARCFCGERKIIRAYGRGSLDAGLRVRCKIVLALVQGSSPTEIARSGMAASSLMYDVMHRFIDQTLLGLADRREDNGERRGTSLDCCGPRSRRL